MKCATCGNDTENDFRYCPNCGAAAGLAHSPASAVVEPSAAAASPVSQASAGSIPQPTAYVRADYDPSRDGRRSQQTADSRTVYAPSAVVEAPRPPTTAQIIMASINIIFVGFGISFVLGIIALVFTIMASSETVISEAAGKIRTAKTLNIVGLVFLAIQLLVLIGLVTAGILMFTQVISQPGTTFGGDYPLG